MPPRWGHPREMITVFKFNNFCSGKERIFVHRWLLLLVELVYRVHLGEDVLRRAATYVKKEVRFYEIEWIRTSWPCPLFCTIEPLSWRSAVPPSWGHPRERIFVHRWLLLLVELIKFNKVFQIHTCWTCIPWSSRIGCSPPSSNVCQEGGSILRERVDTDIVTVSPFP